MFYVLGRDCPSMGVAVLQPRKELLGQLRSRIVVWCLPARSMGVPTGAS